MRRFGGSQVLGQGHVSHVSHVSMPNRPVKAADRPRIFVKGEGGLIEKIDELREAFSEIRFFPVPQWLPTCHAVVSLREELLTSLDIYIHVLCAVSGQSGRLI